MTPFARYALLGSCSVLMASALHGQDDDEFEPRADNCIWLRQLDRTEVIDDQNILFYQHGNRVYRNYLPRACPGLDREERFMYEARSNQLCSVDTITVLEDWGSTGLTRGFTCALGEFRTVTEEEIEELRRTAERKEEIEDARD